MSLNRAPRVHHEHNPNHTSIMSTATQEKPAASQSCPAGQEMPKPLKEHEWLERFAGEWTFEGEASCQPGQSPVRFSGRDSARMIGGFWLVSQGKGDSKEMSYESLLTLGYDPEKEKYVGSWRDSMSAWLWRYEGTVDAGGAVLTLETEGPSPQDFDARAKFREVTEFKSPDHRVFTSSVLGGDGQWKTVVTIHFRRVR